MNEEIINGLLQQLQENLNKVEAARVQVEKTVAAYETLKQSVDYYTKELDSIVNNVQTMISQLEEIKEHFMNNVSSKVIAEIQKGVSTIVAETDKLSSQVSSVHSLIEEKSNDLSHNITQQADSLNDKFSSQFKTLSHEIQLDTEKIHSTIQSSSETIVNAIAESKKKVAKAININRWIIIVGLVILIILHFIM